MPKRAASPDTGADFAKVLAIYCPYPPNANLESIYDRGDFLSWILGAIGNDDFLLAIAYRPKTPRTVLIEVSQKFSPWRKLLGEHKWSECFKTGISEQDKKNSSYCFYSRFHNHRAAEKAGWKIFHIDNTYIRTHDCKDIVASPYPSTRWCNVPTTDFTNESFFRPLVREMFPDAPDTKQKVVVGSSAYVAKRTGAVTDESSNGAGKPSTNGTNRGRSGAPASGVWGRASPSVRTAVPTSSASPSPSTGQPSPASATPVNAWSGPQSRGPPGISIAPLSAGTRGSSTTASSTTVASTTIYSATAYDSLSDDYDEGDTITTLSNTLSDTKLFTSQPTMETQATTIPSGTAEVITDLWGSDEGTVHVTVAAEKFKCPAHQTLCNPNLCAIIEPYLKSIGTSYREQKAGGASNIYSLDAERKKEERAAQEKQGARKRGGRNRGGGGPGRNNAGERW